MHMKLTIAGLIAGFLLLCGGCSQQDTQKTRQEAKQATEQIKEGSKVAAVELKKDLKVAGQQTKAAAQGVRDGLHSPDKPVNINSASKTQLQTLPGVDEGVADRIIAGRPYHTVEEVGARGAVSPEEFDKIKDKVVIK
jgi:DNA uptake protein ComE-like DNA-binding protein